MKKLLFLAAAALTVLTLNARNVFVIIGGKLTPEVLTQNKVIIPSYLSYTDTPDSEHTLYFPATGWFAATYTRCIPSIFPDATEYIVDGYRLTREEFYSFPEEFLTTVACNGNKLVAEIRHNINGTLQGIPAFEKTAEASGIWNEATAQKFPIPANIVVNDPATMPADGLINLDWLLTTATNAAAIPADAINGYILTMYGLYPEMHLFTQPGKIDYFILHDCDRTEIPATAPSTLSVADIAAAANLDPAAIALIRFDGTTLTIFSLPAPKSISEL